MLEADNGSTFEAHALKAWKKILKDITADGATVCTSLCDVANTLNDLAKEETVGC